MSEALIRAQIVTILGGVSGIGVVHNRRRYSRSRAEFKKLMTSGGIINGWMVFRKATPSDRFEMPNVMRYHHYKIVGLYELNDVTATEITFQAILDAIFTAFASNYSLNGTALNSDPIQIDDVDTDVIESEKADIPGTLVHMAELSLDVQDRETYT